MTAAFIVGDIPHLVRSFAPTLGADVRVRQTSWDKDTDQRDECTEQLADSAPRASNAYLRADHRHREDRAMMWHERQEFDDASSVRDAQNERCPIASSGTHGRPPRTGDCTA